jgi:hypothetical protein
VPPLIAHLERHLGPIVRGAEDARLPGVWVVVFSDRPAPGATTYATLGLSHHLLTGVAGRQYRLELLGCSRAEFDALAPEGALLTVAEEMLARHAPLLRGQVVGPAGSIVPGSTLRAFYCTVPVYFPDALAQCPATEPPTVFAWLIPITADEAEFVAVHGWDAFEDLLEACEPDLLDLRRASVVQDQAKHGR